MLNHVSLGSDGVIRSYLEGDQDEVTVSQLINKTTDLLRSISGDGPVKTVKYLVNMSNVGTQTLNARKVGFKALTTLPYEKIAIVGNNRFVKHTVSLLIIASGQGERVQLFDEEPEALDWLHKS